MIITRGNPNTGDAVHSLVYVNKPYGLVKKTQCNSGAWNIFYTEDSSKVTCQKCRAGMTPKFAHKNTSNSIEE